ncbi:MAG: MASE1 domain-containing protein [Candidatus Curtissbacteria bacterium]|nr:MASE1 domain-containing protein [Candidatus Curtissbacteria bacterium]
MKMGGPSYVARLLFLFAIYFTTARLGLSIDAVNGFAMLVWLPTGISLAALIIWGVNYWPAVFAGAFLVNFLLGVPLLAALGIAAGNTLEAIVGAFLLRNVFSLNNALERLRDVWSLILAGGLFATAISATIGVSSLYATGVLTSFDYIRTWLAWWVGDMISALVVTPLILAWSVPRSFKYTRLQIGEFLIASSFLIFMSSMFFTSLLGINTRGLPITYVFFPPLIWYAIRFGQREAVTAVFVLLVMAVVGTIGGFGPFVKGQLNENLLLLQGFMGVASVTVMILAALVIERREHERRKDDFIIIASHELKTPITSAKIFVQILKKHFKNTKDKKLVHYLTTIEDQIDKLTDLIGELLDVSKAHVGKIILNKERFVVDDLINQIVNEIQQHESGRKIVVSHDAKRKVLADRVRIGQVLVNFINNALKYSPEDRDVYVSSEVFNNKVVVYVKDAGIGIRREHQGKIFDRFYRVDDRDKKGGQGFGIGLYISAEIIRRHGGSIGVSSKKDQGSTFFFTLPIVGNGRRRKGQFPLRYLSGGRLVRF